MRSRVIKPEFWGDEKLARLSRDSRLTFVGIWTASDDYGVCKGHPAWLKSQIYPYEEDLKMSQFSKWLEELEQAGRIIKFTHDAEVFYFIPHFTEHQKVDHPSKQRNPEPPENILETLANDSRDFRVETETETETETEKKHIPLPGVMERFNDFWKAYPKKKSKGDAEKAWKKIRPSNSLVDEMLTKLIELLRSEDWLKENGKYIPYPATWLNKKGWEDEYTQVGYIDDDLAVLEKCRRGEG